MGCTPSKPPDGMDSTQRVMGGRKAIDKSERIHTRTERKQMALRRGQSTARLNAKSGKAEPLVPPKLDSQGQLVAEEVSKRISGSIESTDTIVGELKSGATDGMVHVRYAALTQRGYYPDNPHKENQDSYFINPSKFASGEGDAFFAVFDGHGDTGHDCARFAKQILPLKLAAAIKKKRAAENARILRELDAAGQPKPKNAFHPTNWPYLDKETYEECCRTAHLQCNKAMHDDKKVKDMMSGTTAISVGFHAGRMTVSNVGDSRVVLGHRTSDEMKVDSTPSEEEKKEITEISEFDDSEHAPTTIVDAGAIVAIPLSEDQTPYRKDERERLKEAGARVCSIDQMEGKEPMHENWGEVDLGVDIDEHGDPPRVWCKDHDYPGTAFSRSLGDTVGEDIGVGAEPEIVTKEITKGDEILVIASDGIFEFLTNQRVIDVCAECDDPQRACARLLEESYRQWLHYELRTDDITCIVLFLNNSRPDDDAEVRRLMSKRHRVKKKAGTQHGGSIVVPAAVAPAAATLAAATPAAATPAVAITAATTPAATTPAATTAAATDGAESGSYDEFMAVLEQ